MDTTLKSTNMDKLAALLFVASCLFNSVRLYGIAVRLAPQKNGPNGKYYTNNALKGLQCAALDYHDGDADTIGGELNYFMRTQKPRQ